MSKLINFTCLGIFTLVLAAGQLLFKRVGLSIRGMPVVQAGSTLLKEPALYVALVTYGVATLLWIWILARVPLAQAYPWVGVGLVVVPLLSAHFFGERVTPLFWLGAALVTAGVMVTQLSVSAS